MSDQIDDVSIGQTNDVGFADPNEQFPRSQYWYGSAVNHAASGRSRNDLWTGGNQVGEETEIVSSRYYDNQVQETKSGHVIELDDTAGNERVLIKHNTGGGVELRNDGSMIITTVKNKLEVTGGESKIIVEGDGNLEYRGNLTLDVTGDLDINCMNFNVNAKGNKKENIEGSYRTTVGKNHGVVVGEAFSQTIVGQTTSTFLSGYSQNIKGTFANNVEGDAGFFASGNTTITTENVFRGSADNMTLAANNMTVIGGNGVIGGDSVHIKGQEASFEGSVEAPTFYGNLIGKAKFAALADKATGASTAGSLGGSGTASYPSDPGEPSFVEPTTALVTTYLTKAAGGIRKVSIDFGNYLRNAIFKTETYGGISSTDMAASKARSRLRDEANRNNVTTIQTLIGSGVISPTFKAPSPAGIGRVAKYEDAGISVPSGTPYIPKRNEVVKIIPEYKYNPLFQGLITTKTKLADGITVAKFLGTEDGTNLDFIKDDSRKADIARYLYLHAQYIKAIQDNKKQFENVRIKVTEGLYKPGPTETITAGSINDLKLKGRAVAYDIIDINSKSDRDVLFDVITYFKDTQYYDELILSYDTIDPYADDGLTARIIVILPELDDNWSGNYRRIIKTEYNNYLLANNEFVEALPYPSTKNVTAPGNVSLDDTSASFEIAFGPDAFTRRTSRTHPEIQPGAEATLAEMLENQFQLLQTYFGSPLTITDALPVLETDRKPPSRGGASQHWYGRAIDVRIVGMTDQEKNKLATAAAKAGFKGFGFGLDILHLDIGSKRKWNYENAYWAGRLITDWYRWHSDNVRG